MKAKLKKRGTGILGAEVSHISAHGLWVLVGEREYLLSFAHYPAFSDAKVSELLDVNLLHGRHLRWDILDIDVDLGALEEPDKYPLVYR